VGEGFSRWLGRLVGVKEEKRDDRVSGREGKEVIVPDIQEIVLRK